MKKAFLINLISIGILVLVLSGVNILRADTLKSITVISPNGGESLQAGEIYTITWTSSGVEKINLYLNGSCYGTTAEKVCVQSQCVGPLPLPKCMVDCNNVLIASNIDASLGKYSWKVPISQTLFTDAKIYIQEVVSDVATQTCLSDSSDKSFGLIQGKTCNQKCTSLNYQSGTCQSFAVSPEGFELAENFEQQHDSVGETSDCYLQKDIVGVTKSCYCSPKKLVLTSPNGGEGFYAGSTYDITWQATGIDKIGIYLTDIGLEGGITRAMECLYDIKCADGTIYCGPCLESIATNISASLGKYSWTIPADSKIVKAKIFIEATDVLPVVNDVSGNYFYITNKIKDCSDSDGGKDYYTKGVAKGLFYNNKAEYVEEADYCSGDSLKVEYFCNEKGYVESIEGIDCPNGCENGACKTATCSSSEWLCSLTNKCVSKGATCCNGLLGGCIDEHGCNPTAGYAWCELKQKCLRTWEESCSMTTPTPTPTPVTFCGWCGISCVKKTSEQICMAIAPPDGYDCKEINSQCQAIKKEISCEISVTCVTGYVQSDTGLKDSSGCLIKKCVPIYPDNSIIKFLDNPKVYLIIKGKKLWVSSVQAFNQLNLLWSKIKIASQSEGDQYPTVKLIKTKNLPKVYEIMDFGYKHYIPTVTIFESYGHKWSDIVELEKTTVDTYPEAYLIRLKDDVKVYKLEGQIKKWIKTAEAFERLGYKWAMISTINKTEFDFYPEGSPIE